MSEEARRIRKERTGVVISAKSLNTVTVEVKRTVQHKRYGKYLTVRKRYKAHDVLGCKEGDLVMITESRPISKTKRWRVSSRLNKDGTPQNN